MDKPFFSVIIPALNEEKFLPQLLFSLEKQTCTDFETVVVDGSSTDRTVAAAKVYAKKLKPFDIIIDRASLPYQRNLGAEATKGKWLVFVDADSVFLPYALERMQEFINTAKPLAFTTWCVPDSNTPKDALLATLANATFETLLLIKRPFTPGPLTVIRRDIFDQVGKYDENHAFNEDVDLGLRLDKMGISVTIFREALYVWSQRRFRKENKLKMVQQYFLSILPVLFAKKSLRFMPGYTMGGQFYDSDRKKQLLSNLKKTEFKIRRLIKEFFE